MSATTPATGTGPAEPGDTRSSWPALSAKDANQTLAHEMCHAYQYERELGDGRNWNVVRAAAEEAASGGKMWNSWIEAEARALAEDWGPDYTFATK
jgi:hypothetical protein